jgi:protein required for attachment to host cells
MMTWIVTANSNLCRIYHLDAQMTKADLIKEINYPINRLKSSEHLTTDKPGRYQTDGGVGGAYSPHTDPKAVEVDNFARDIARELNQGRNTNAYKDLILIVPAHMQGLLNNHLDKHVKAMITHEIQKDVMTLSQKETISFLEKYIKNPSE